MFFKGGVRRRNEFGILDGTTRRDSDDSTNPLDKFDDKLNI